MASAASVHLPNGFFAMNGGFEHPGLLGFAGHCGRRGAPTGG